MDVKRSRGEGSNDKERQLRLAKKMLRASLWVLLMDGTGWRISLHRVKGQRWPVSAFLLGGDAATLQMLKCLNVPISMFEQVMHNRATKRCVLMRMECFLAKKKKSCNLSDRMECLLNLLGLFYTSIERICNGQALSKQKTWKVTE